ncbi:MAG: polysaccharide biosynthesis protein [Clostridia bacterium]|nr:polysaccharide biosynthesis protein [Clostridia bacterium]
MGTGTGNKIINKILVVLLDISAVFFAAVLAYFASKVNTDWTKIPIVYVYWLLANIALALIVFTIFGLYSMVFKSVSVLDFFKIVISAVIIGAANVAFAIFTERQYIDLATTFVYVVTLSIIVGIIRFSERIIAAMKFHFSHNFVAKKRVIIIGGGDAATALLKEVQSSDKIQIRPMCILDDDPEKKRESICGVRVVGTTAEIAHFVKKYDAEEIFIAMPSVNKKRISEIVSSCQNLGCAVKILPGIYQFVSGQIAVSQFRDVGVQDLLGREQVQVNLDEIMGYIENKVVLVTGGGGSIGSELCRQIATHSPKALIILDIYENNAYEIEQELKRRNPQLHLLTLIASVRDSKKMRDIFEKYRPQIVFHAAAHKHVPLMETSPNEAVKNNVYGTWNVAKCADEFEVETFVQISTDKAVNPTNIMGATKRICEMIIQTIGRHSKKTKFVAVRFGNVLGSNGSVIPLFKKQIAEGGPVTVTHKDIIRYFMTIPEAVSLVLQAGAYAKGGQIFVLDMGDPVRIYDLAYNLIKLSGYEPNVDIDIVCTGLRPGEKLYEERLMEEEGLTKTPNGLINIAKPIPLNETRFWPTLQQLCDEAYAEAEDMKKSVKKLVPTYTIDKRDSIAEALREVKVKKTANKETAKK